MLRPLVGDLTRKGIVRPAGVSESIGAAHASSENHNNRVDTAEKRFGIIPDEWMDRAILEFKAQARESGESYSPSRTTAGWGVMQAREGGQSSGTEERAQKYPAFSAKLPLRVFGSQASCGRRAAVFNAQSTSGH